MLGWGGGTADFILFRCDHARNKFLRVVLLHRTPDAPAKAVAGGSSPSEIQK
jgi:hypothetical protein